MQTLIFLAGIVAAAAVGAEQSAVSSLAPRSSRSATGAPFSEQEIRAFAAEVAPQIEKVMERKFKKLPPLVIDDTEATARILAADMEPLFRRQYPDWPEGQIAGQALAAARRLAPELLGKYGVRAETLALRPSDLPGTLREHRIHPAHARGILKTLVAHELTHALQAQYVDLIRLYAGSRSDDALAAVTAVIEGQAMLVQQEVAKALGWADAESQYTRIFTGQTADFPDPAHLGAKARQEFTYIEGKRFAQWHYEQGKAARLWEVLAKPPPLTAMIARPEKYASVAPPRPDLAPVLKPLADLWQRRGWLVTQEELGEIDLRAAYASADRATVEAITEPVRAARQMVVQAPKAPARFQVTVFELADPQAGGRALALHHQAILGEVEVYRKGWRLRSRRFERRPFRARAPTAMCYSVILEDENGQPGLDRTILVATRGTRLVEVVIDDYTMPLGEMRQLVDCALGPP